jgi:hypothetical protein
LAASLSVYPFSTYLRAYCARVSLTLAGLPSLLPIAFKGSQNLKPADGVPSWITQAVEKLGPEIGYSNLIYWAYENMIKAEEVDKTLKALVNMGYLTPIVEVRCPECGAHLGISNS